MQICAEGDESPPLLSSASATSENLELLREPTSCRACARARSSEVTSLSNRRGRAFRTARSRSSGAFPSFDTLLTQLYRERPWPVSRGRKPSGCSGETEHLAVDVDAGFLGVIKSCSALEPRAAAVMRWIRAAESRFSGAAIYATARLMTAARGEYLARRCIALRLAQEFLCGVQR